MKKYKTEFKREVGKSFLAGKGGAKLLARQWAVPEEKIRTWVSHYRLHGIDGLRPKRSAYSAQFKLQVLSRQDRERLSSRQVAAVYDIRNPNKVNERLPAEVTYLKKFQALIRSKRSAAPTKRA
ncbi:transposase [Hylemonella gracilis]|nr:transposase [Hylemonella gracilis]